MMTGWQQRQEQEALAAVAVARTLLALDRLRRKASAGGWLSTGLMAAIRARQDALRAAGVRE